MKSASNLGALLKQKKTVVRKGSKPWNEMTDDEKKAALAENLNKSIKSIKQGGLQNTTVYLETWKLGSLTASDISFSVDTNGVLSCLVRNVNTGEFNGRLYFTLPPGLVQMASLSAGIGSCHKDANPESYDSWNQSFCYVLGLPVPDELVENCKDIHDRIKKTRQFFSFLADAYLARVISEDKAFPNARKDVNTVIANMDASRVAKKKPVMTEAEKKENFVDLLTGKIKIPFTKKSFTDKDGVEYDLFEMMIHQKTFNAKTFIETPETVIEQVKADLKNTDPVIRAKAEFIMKAIANKIWFSHWNVRDIRGNEIVRNYKDSAVRNGTMVTPLININCFQFGTHQGMSTYVGKSIHVLSNIASEVADDYIPDDYSKKEAITKSAVRVLKTIFDNTRTERDMSSSDLKRILLTTEKMEIGKFNEALALLVERNIIVVNAEQKKCRLKNNDIDISSYPVEEDEEDEAKLLLKNAIDGKAMNDQPKFTFVNGDRELETNNNNASSDNVSDRHSEMEDHDAAPDSPQTKAEKLSLKKQKARDGGKHRSKKQKVVDDDDDDDDGDNAKFDFN